jgi:hypothetical protein
VISLGKRTFGKIIKVLDPPDEMKVGDDVETESDDEMCKENDRLPKKKTIFRQTR